MEGRNVTLGESAPEENVRYGGIGHYLSEKINSEPDNFNSRITVLGHVQRGGIPSATDRLIAAGFGVHAVDIMAEGKNERMVVWRDGKVADVSMDEVASIGTARVDPNCDMIQTARGLGMYVGEI